MSKASKVTAIKAAISKKSGIKPPTHLKSAGRKLWISVAESFELEDHDHVLLTALAETLDRKVAAEKELREHGSLTFTNRHEELKPHPLIAVVRDCNMTIARLRRELSLSEMPDESRPPRLRYGGPK